VSTLGYNTKKSWFLCRPSESEIDVDTVTVWVNGDDKVLHLKIQKTEKGIRCGSNILPSTQEVLANFAEMSPAQFWIPKGIYASTIPSSESRTKIKLVANFVTYVYCSTVFDHC